MLTGLLVTYILLARGRGRTPKYIILPGIQNHILMGRHNP